MVEEGGCLLGEFEYNSDLFDRLTIERMCSHYVRLLEMIVESPSNRLSELDILTELERRQQLLDWNDTGVDYPKDKCIRELFEEHR